jgi:hypothetical protein
MCKLLPLKSALFGPPLVAMMAIVLAVLLFGPSAASAQGTCIDDVWKAHGNSQDLTCTANDVTLSTATNIQISAGGSCDSITGVCKCFAGQTVTFTADFQMDLTAQTRYDVGFYIAQDNDSNGDGALTGQCSATASLAGNTQGGTFINLDQASQPGDVCGDITGPLNTTHNPLLVRATISAQCPAGGDEQLVLPFCTTWRQPGSNTLCTGTGDGPSTNGVYPGSPSKCNCGDLAIDIFSETPTITVTKTATTTGVPETGGSGSYSVTVKNDGTIPVTLTSLTDNKYGSIATTHAANASCTGSATPGVCQAVTATTCVADADVATCQVGGEIAAGATCSCTFTGTVPPGDFPGSYTDIVEGCANNVTSPTPVCDTDDAVIPYQDVEQPPTLTKIATNPQCVIDTTYNVTVTNSSAQDTLTLNTLNDDQYGDITVAAGASCTGKCIVSTTCGLAGTGNPGALPNVIAVSSGYSCSFVGRLSTCNTTLVDVVTGSATDDDGASYSPFDDATVTVTVTTP